MISHAAIEQAAYDVMCKAAIDIPEDYLGAIREMARTEQGPGDGRTDAAGAAADQRLAVGEIDA